MVNFAGEARATRPFKTTAPPAAVPAEARTEAAAGKLDSRPVPAPTPTGAIDHGARASGAAPEDQKYSCTPKCIICDYL